MTTALLLIAHGSRREEANEDLDELASAVAGLGCYPIIESCYLELAEPDVEAGGARCVARGAGRVLMLPYFLAAGVHVVHDLEEARGKLCARFPAVDFRLCRPIGRHPLMVEIVSQRAAEAEADRNTEPQ